MSDIDEIHVRGLISCFSWGRMEIWVSVPELRMVWINRFDGFPCSHMFGWPIRSVERLAPIDFSRLKAPVLVIGNTVRPSPSSPHHRASFTFVSQADPVTSFVGAQSTAKLLGDHATLIEQLGVGHTSVAQFSTCTLGIVVNFVLASKVGSSLPTL